MRTPSRANQHVWRVLMFNKENESTIYGANDINIE